MKTQTPYTQKKNKERIERLRTWLHTNGNKEHLQVVELITNGKLNLTDPLIFQSLNELKVFLIHSEQKGAYEIEMDFQKLVPFI